MSFKRFRTEKMLLVSIGILSLFLFASAFSKELGTNASMAEEDSDASGASSNETSNNSEGSDSEDSASEEDSDPSVSPAPSVRTTQTGSVEEISEKSSNETSQQSVEEASEPSEKSQEFSEESIKYVEGYGNVVSREGNVALVKKDEKLFFLIPVKVEFQVTLDEQGSVVNTKRSFLNWLLSVFSF